MPSQPTNLHVYDDLNHLFLTNLYLPPRTTVLASSDDRGTRTRSDWRQLPIEEGLGRALHAVAASQAEPYLAAAGADVDRIPLETYLFKLSSSGHGRLQAWFAGEPVAATYRVLLHRTPAIHVGRGLPLLWDAAYEVIRSGGTPTLRCRPVSTDALRDGAIVLGEGLLAYRAGPEAVRAFIDGLGHLYHHVV